MFIDIKYMYVYTYVYLPSIVYIKAIIVAGNIRHSKGHYSGTSKIFSVFVKTLVVTHLVHIKSPNKLVKSSLFLSINVI